ncbi:TRAP transporter small permease [Litorisediminicola beolgyonensis]|uniref:TRAP transporter small permease protein n=1 Tax=Litorisediminicola beolgyonensis TaxID=1173614 RepID=A0ABW3ZM56_9RHOB
MSSETPAAGGVTRWLRSAIAAICAVLLLAMMALTVADVLGRYLLNAPVNGATELTELMLAAVIFVGLPAASLDNDHIKVDVLTLRLGETAGRVLEKIVALFCIGVLGVIAWRLWKIGDQIGGYGGITPTLKVPVAPLAYVIAVLCCVAALITLIQIFERRPVHV